MRAYCPGGQPLEGAILLAMESDPDNPRALVIVPRTPPDKTPPSGALARGRGAELEIGELA